MLLFQQKSEKFEPNCQNAVNFAENQRNSRLIVKI